MGQFSSVVRLPALQSQGPKFKSPVPQKSGGHYTIYTYVKTSHGTP